MKAIMLMFDSLNRHMLSCYGGEAKTPNFDRLAARAVTFDNSYVGSMPCMPARRELHTGRYNFLHRSWGPLEPFDDSAPRLLGANGIHSHLVSDHYHYWETGGATYHTAYTTWQAVRGQEGDPHIADLTDAIDLHPDSYNNTVRGAAGRAAGRMGPWLRQDWVNRHYTADEADMPQPRTMAAGIEFLRTNAAADNWFLHIETFDPHEPYQVPQRFLDMYAEEDADYTGPHFDWPPYRAVRDDEREHARHLRIVNAALVSMCDHYLGRVLDAMDELGLWDDTLLIVNTDHGFLLGEHDMWGKCWCPFYNEIAHTPLFIWDPRTPDAAGRRRDSLVQTIDLPATLLEYFGLDRPADMQGVPLRQTVADDTPVRTAALFGNHGGHVNVTDGRYVYMRAPAGEANEPLHNYTHMPTHMRDMFSPAEMSRMTELAPPFTFTKSCPTMKIPAGGKKHTFQTMLFDLASDPKQEHPIDDPAVEAVMTEHLVRLMEANDAPVEQYERLGLERP